MLVQLLLEPIKLSYSESFGAKNLKEGQKKAYY
jgi:hypothetical protein